MPGLLTLIGIGALGYAAALGYSVCLCKAAARPTPPPDPAFRFAPDAADPAIVEDRLWEGIEREWHAFVDSLPEVRA